MMLWQVGRRVRELGKRHLWQHRLRLLLLLPAAALLGFAFMPEGRLRCETPYLIEHSPDGRWSLTVCGRPQWFAMPGSGSDAPGWIVLRDADDAIRGVSSLTMLQLYGGAESGFGIEWHPSHVAKAMVLDLPLDAATSPFDRWWTDRVWRLRTLFRITPGDETLS